MNDKQRQWAELVATGCTKAQACRDIGYSEHSVKELSASCGELIVELIQKNRLAREKAALGKLGAPRDFIRAELLELIERLKTTRIPVKQRNGLQMKDADGNLLFTLGDTTALLKALDQLAKLEKLYETEKVDVNINFEDAYKKLNSGREDGEVYELGDFRATAGTAGSGALIPV